MDAVCLRFRPAILAVATGQPSRRSGASMPGEARRTKVRADTTKRIAERSLAD
jgi:hypothetical protein